MSDPTTPTRPPLEEIRARVEAATPGPWTDEGGSIWSPEGPVAAASDDGKPFGMHSAVIAWEPPDRAFIAHARTDLPAALDWIAHVEGLLARAVLRVELMPNHGADCGYWASSAGSRTCTCGGNGLAADIRAALGGGR